MPRARGGWVGREWVSGGILRRTGSSKDDRRENWVVPWKKKKIYLISLGLSFLTCTMEHHALKASVLKALSHLSTKIQLLLLCGSREQSLTSISLRTEITQTMTYYQTEEERKSWWYP